MTLLAILLVVHEVVSPGPTASREYVQSIADNFCAPKKARITGSRVDRGSLRTKFVCVAKGKL